MTVILNQTATVCVAEHGEFVSFGDGLSFIVPADRWVKIERNGTFYRVIVGLNADNEILRKEVVTVKGMVVVIEWRE